MELKHFIWLSILLLFPGTLIMPQNTGKVGSKGKSIPHTDSVISYQDSIIISYAENKVLDSIDLALDEIIALQEKEYYDKLNKVKQEQLKIQQEKLKIQNELTQIKNQNHKLEKLINNLVDSLDRVNRSVENLTTVDSVCIRYRGLFGNGKNCKEYQYFYTITNEK